MSDRNAPSGTDARVHYYHVPKQLVPWLPTGETPGTFFPRLLSRAMPQLGVAEQYSSFAMQGVSRRDHAYEFTVDANTEQELSYLAASRGQRTDDIIRTLLDYGMMKRRERADLEGRQQAAKGHHDHGVEAIHEEA